MAPKFYYQPVRTDGDSNIDTPPNSPKRPRGRHARRLAILIGVTFVGLVVLLFITTWDELPQLPFQTKTCHDQPDGYQCRPEISHFWGQYSPFHSIPSEVSAEVPQGCEVTFAQVLSRHGSRDPTLSRSIALGALVARLHKDVRRFEGPYRFLNSYEYSLGADELTTFGENELVRSGEAFYTRYSQLANKVMPFVRAAGQHRVVVSAKKFTQGMQKAALKHKSPLAKAYPPSLLIIPEGRSSNNTLSAELCDAVRHEPHRSNGRLAREVWAEIFAQPIASRLNNDLPGANLSTHDTISLMDLCPFTTIASRVGALTPFCDLFTPSEWWDYDYFQTLGKHYGYGHGHPLGPTQGVGFVNELIARLTGKPVQDHTTVNHTLDDAPDTFPIGGTHQLFADFSHDNDMIAIYAALGLHNSTKRLDTSHRTSPSAAGGFAASWTVPFAGRMYVEKMQCMVLSQETYDNSQAHENAELVRVLINDRVVPLQGCGADALGRCRLDRFLKSLEFARNGGKWEECFLPSD